MSDDFGNDFITITDDEGNEFELEHLDTAEINGSMYMAFLPADMDENDDEYGLIILKVVTENDEEVFISVDDETELNAAYDFFVQKLFDDEKDDKDGTNE